MPTLLDLVWKPSVATPELPTDSFPRQAPAIYRGDGYSLWFVLSDTQYATPVPYVPEGDFQAQVRLSRLRKDEVPGEPLATFEVTVGGDDGNEEIASLTGDQTAALPDSAFWDIQEVFDDSEPTTWFTGKVKAWGDITRVDA